MKFGKPACIAGLGFITGKGLSIPGIGQSNVEILFKKIKNLNRIRGSVDKYFAMSLSLLSKKD